MSDPFPPLARGGAFPETRWSLVLAGGASRGGEAAIEALACAYWRPVYGFVRARRARTDQDALDATQDFFLWMLESGFLSKANPGRGRFRAFVKVALDRFLTDLERTRNAQKRGGGRRFVPLEGRDGHPLALPDASGRAPEDVLDDLWRAELLERAARELGRQLEDEGRAAQFAIFEDHFLDDAALGYDELAQRHGVSRTDVSNWLSRTKKRYRELLRRVVLETVDDAEALTDELAWLFADEDRA